MTGLDLVRNEWPLRAEYLRASQHGPGSTSYEAPFHRGSAEGNARDPSEGLPDAHADHAVLSRTQLESALYSTVLK
jgi:hypothetical protein